MRKSYGKLQMQKAFLLTVLIFTGCTTADKNESPPTLLQDACGIGSANSRIQGSVWMSLHSKDANGNFPANVNAQGPDSVILEVTNLLGGREALISVSHDQYTIDLPASKGGVRKGQGNGSWGGIPLRWASELFLGRFPCPADRKHARMSIGKDGDLTVQSAGEKFTYRFRRWAGKAWPEALHWEGSRHVAVDFKFDDPEDKSGSPKKWEAKSSLGEVKLRWRDIQINGS